MKTESETQNMDSNVTISEADGKSLLENSGSESFYQRLNKLHNSSGLNLLFDLRQSTLDLHLFYKEVTARGGFIQVTTDERWGEVALALKLDGDNLQDPQPLLKLYALFLYQYEQLYYYREPHAKAASTLGHGIYSIGDSSAMEGQCSDNSCQMLPNLENALAEKKMPKKDFQPTLIGSTSSEQKLFPQLSSKRKEMKKRCGAPRGAQSGYHIYLRKECERLKSTDAGKLKGQNFRAMADNAWRSFSETEKLPYIEASKKVNGKRLAQEVTADEENQGMQNAEREKKPSLNRDCHLTNQKIIQRDDRFPTSPSNLVNHHHHNRTGKNYLSSAKQDSAFCNPHLLAKTLDSTAYESKKMSTSSTTNLPHNIKPNESTEDIKSPTPKLSQKTILHIVNTKCATSLQRLKQAHGVALRSGHFQDHYVAGAVVKCYASNNFGLALKVFDCVWRPNVFVWNIVIKGCLEHNEAFSCVSYYCKMVDMNARPNKFTYSMLFKACTLAQAVEEGLQIHAHVVKNQFGEDGHIRSAGIQMYASFGLVEEARIMLDEGGEANDVVCWNAMIDGYMKCGDVEAAKELFYKHMPSKNIGSWNAMVSGLARCGRIEEARELFDGMSERDEISWSAMIDGYIQGGFHKEALEIFNDMQKENLTSPKKFVLSSVLAACANVGALDQGKWIHAHIKKNNIQLDAVLGTALLDMYAKCGRIDMAWEVFENVKQKEISTWNAMIGALAMHGRAEDAIELFAKMQMRKLEPNGITFLNALNACAHSGFVEKGLEIFSSMKRFYGIEPEVEHYGCAVDMFGRAGKLEEAEQLINLMPIEPNAAVWGALLGACRIHGNVEMGERVGKILLELEPQNSGRYTLLSNIYAKAGRFDDAAKVRALMKERGVKTSRGISMVDIGGIVHEFKVGDGSHPSTKEVYSTLERIIEKLQTEGYSPSSSQVLFDIAEEEKETALQYHSEKLAIAFGVLNTKPGTAIRVTKNLRICEDCHSAVKIFSRVYERDVIVRDRMRYHHFRNGRCSCKDFW
ncbi:hypothetical protein COP2_010471 [Malus domestica]